MNNNQTVGVFTPQDAAAIKKKVLHGDYTQTQMRYTERNKYDWHYGILKADLLAVCDPLTEYTQAEAAVIMYLEASDTLEMEEITTVDDRVTITNRSPFTSYYTGELVLFRWVVKEWVIVGQSIQRVQAVMQADLAAAIDTLNDPSTAVAKILIKKTNGDLKVLTTELTVVNRFVNISISAGTYVKLEYIGGEWQPYAGDCPGPMSFSSSQVGSTC